MAEVGVLNLEVNANTSSAGKKLDDLVGALKRVKEAIAGGLNLGSVARGIERLGQVVNEQMSEQTITKIGKLSDALGKLKSEGNVNIVISSDSIERMRESVDRNKDALREAEQVAESFGDEFDDSLEVTESRLELLRDKLSILKDELQKGIDKDSFDDKKVINYKLQILGLEKEIDNLTEAQERANNADYYQDLTTTFSTIDLYKMKYSALYDKLMKNIESGSWGEDKIASAMLQLEKLHDKIFSLREEMNGGEGLRILDQDQKDELFELADGYLQANDEASRLKTQISALKEELGNGIKYGTMTETQLTKLADKIARYESKLSKLAPVMEEVAQNAQEFNDALESVEPAVDAASETAEATKEVIASNTEEEMEYLRELEKRIADVKEEAAESEALRKEQEEKFYEPPETYSFEQTNAMADNLTQLDLLKAQLNDAERKYNEFVNTLGAGSVKTIKAGLAVSDLRDKIWQYEQEMESAQNAPVPEYFDMDQTNAMVDNITQLDLLQAKLTESEIQYNQFVNELGVSNSKTIQAGLAVADLRDKIAHYGEKTEEAKEATKEAAQETKKAKGLFESLKGTIKGLFPVLSKLIGRFAKLAVTRTLRTALSHIASGFKEGLENVYHYSQAIGSSFAPALDSATSAILQMKNSLGAAAAPLIQSLIPYLQIAVKLFIELVNWVNQLLSLLRGQATWTRAVPATATAFGKQEKAAKGAAAAMKDLLADWDELNIIQSQTSGAGAGAGTSAAEDYLNMFEEVSTFSKNAKDVANFLKDNFGDILTLVEGIGAAILTWRISKAFGETLGFLRTLELTAGITLLIKGVKLTTAAGYDIGANGLNSDNLLKAAGGIFEGALGTGLIGVAFGGIEGGAIGLTIGTMIGLIALGVSMSEGEKDQLYGDISLTPEEIQQEVDKLFTFDVTAHFQNAQVDHESLNEAKTTLSTAIQDADAAYATFKLKLDAGSADALATSVGVIVDSASRLLSQMQKKISIGFGFDVAFDDPELQQQLATADITGMDTYIKGLGEQIGAILEDGIVDGVNESALLDELMKKLTHVTEAIARGRAAANFAVDLEKGNAGRDWTQVDRQGIIEYAKQYEEAVSKVREAAYLSATDTAETLAARYSGMVARNEVEPNTYSETEIQNALDAYNNYMAKFDEIVESFVNGATAGGRNKFAENMFTALSSAAEKKTGYDVNLGDSELGSLGLRKWFQQNLGMNLGWGSIFGDANNKAFTEMLDLTGSTGWDLLSDKVKTRYIGAIVKALGKSSDTYRKIKEELGVSLEEILSISSTGWNNWDTKARENFIKYLQDAYGKDAVYEALKASGYEGLIFGEVQEAAQEAAESVPDFFATPAGELVLDFSNVNETTENGGVPTFFSVEDIDLSELPGYDGEKLHVAGVIDMGMSDGAQAIMQYVLNAVGSGKGIDEITAATLQGITDRGPEAWVEVQDIVNEIVSAYREMEKNGFVDTEALMRKYGQYGTAGVPSGEQVHLDEGDLSSGVQAGTERANAEQNTILREGLSLLRMLNNKQLTIVYLPNTTAARVNKQSDVMFANVTGDV